MSSETNKIFPIFDRRAPVIERIRGDKEAGQDGEEIQEFGRKLGKEIVMISRLNEDERQEVLSLIDSGLVEGIADALGEDVTDLDITNAESIVDSLDVDMEDFLIDDDADEEEESETSF
jgi:hypothetical protein